MEVSVDIVEDYDWDFMRKSTGLEPKKIVAKALGLLLWAMEEDKKGRIIVSSDSSGRNALRIPSNWLTSDA